MLSCMFSRGTKKRHTEIIGETRHNGKLRADTVTRASLPFKEHSESATTIEDFFQRKVDRYISC